MTVYYVDPAGSDSNTGLSEAQAWATLGKACTAATVGGDEVRFQNNVVFRGSTFTNTHSGSAANPILFRPYVYGLPSPVLSGGQIITGWTSYAANIWKSAAVSEVTSVTVNSVLQWSRAGANIASPWLPQTDTRDTLTADHPWTWRTTDGCLYLYSTTDPGTKVVEGAVRDVFVSNGYGGITVRELEFRHAYDRALSFRNTSNQPNLAPILVQDCTWRYNGFKSNSGVFAASNHKGGRITGSLMEWNNNDGSYFSACPEWEYDNNVIQHVFRWESDGVQFQGNNDGTLDLGVRGNEAMNVHHNTIDLTGSDSHKGCILINGPTGDGGTIHHNTVTGGAFGVQCGADGIMIEHNVCTGQRTAGGSAGINVAGDTWTASRGVFRYNTIIDCQWGINFTLKGYEKRGFLVYQNTIYGCNGGIQMLDPVSGAIVNNIIWNPGGTSELILVSAIAPGEDLQLDYNQYGPTLKWKLGSSVTTLAAWRTLSGYDQHSGTGDPLFVNAAAGNYALQAGSPAAGAALPLHWLDQVNTNRGAN